jgi:hypothetical protein
MRPQADFAEVETLKLLFKHADLAGALGPQHGATDDAYDGAELRSAWTAAGGCPHTKKISSRISQRFEALRHSSTLLRKILDRAGGL